MVKQRITILLFAFLGIFAFYANFVVTNAPATANLEKNTSEALAVYTNTEHTNAPNNKYIPKTITNASASRKSSSSSVVDLTGLNLGAACITDAVEDFDYNAGSSINSANGGSGFSGSWTQPDGNFATIENGSLTHSGLSSAGNKIRLQPNTSARTLRRNLANPITGTTTFWISALVRGNNITDQGFWIKPDGRQELAIGKRWGTNFAIDNNDGGYGMSEGNTYWLVAKYEMSSSGNDVAYLWVNPDPTQEPSNASAIATKSSNIGSSIDYIEIGHDGGTGANYLVDQLKLTCAYPSTAASTSSCNVLVNSEFDNGTSNWNATNAATFSIDNSGQLSGANSAYFDVTQSFFSPWQTEFEQGGHQLQSNKTYKISLDAKAVANRPIHVQLQLSEFPWTTYWSEVIYLTTSKQTFELNNISPNITSGNIGLTLMFGYNTTNFWVDNIVFQEQSCGAVPSAEICGNGIDDDGDGAIDNLDSDCSSSSPCTNSFQQNSTNVPKSISSQGAAIVVSTMNVSQSGTITDLDISNLNISHTYLFDLSIYLVSPAGTWVTLLQNKCGGNKDIRIRFDDDSPYSTLPCPPINDEYYPPHNPLSAFNGENMQGTWTLRVNDGQQGDGGSINSWGLLFNSDCLGAEICNNGIDDDGDGYIDDGDSDCVSGTCPYPTLNFQNPSLYDGTASEEGAIYLFEDIIPGTDAHVKIVKKSHSNISFVNIDQPESVNGGYEFAFQPQIDYNFTSGQYQDRWIEFEFSFYEAGTTIRKSVPKTTMSAIDVDGNGTSLNIREFVESQDFDGYQLQSNSVLTLSGALRALGSTPVESGVDETALHTMISYDFSNVEKINVNFGAKYSSGSNPNNIGEQRMNCLFFKCYEFNTVEECPTIELTGSGKACTDESVALSVTTGNTSGTCNITWQQSSNETSWSTISGVTGNSYTTPLLTQTTYYRASIYCGGTQYCGTRYSDVHIVTINSCGEICGNGIDDDGDGDIDEADTDCPNSPEICGNGIDDDGDGLIDNNDPDCDTSSCMANGQSVTSQTGVTNSNNSLDSADGNYAQLYETGDVLVVDLGEQLSVGTNYTIRWRRGLSTSSNPSVKVEESANGFNWTTAAGSPFSFSNTSFFDQNISASTTTRYIRISSTNVYDTDLDAITATWDCTEICNNGIDDDRDGLIDCADGNCGSPTNVSVQAQNPSNCPTLNNGQITVSALGSNLEYSINGGTSYQSNNTFTGLTAGNYSIRVRNSVSGCTKNYTSTITLSNPTCIEICGNGTDDDGDTLTDCDDPDCGRPTIQSVVPKNPDNCPTLNNGTITITASGSNLEYSIDGGSTYHTNNIFTNLSDGNFTIKVQNTATGCIADYGNTITLSDPVCVEICNNNHDDDGDGLEDCDDPDCGQPVISSITPANPSNCPVLNNGTITITASGNNLEYSIDAGTNYQASATFADLQAGSYNLIVRNTATGCFIVYENNPIAITSPTCMEICDNGIDDDGDNLTDCDDPDCGKPVALNNTFITNGNSLSGSVANSTNGTAVQYTIVTLPTKGNVTLNSDGTFTFTATLGYCGPDEFEYQVCFNNCCTNATISLDITDNCTEICGDGIDNDGNGKMDCEDIVCGKPAITAVDATNPANCPDLTNGQITITATGDNLEYSIDNGANYQPSNIFDNLVAANYTIRVVNTLTGCDSSYANNPVVISKPVCLEECDNGIDDDGDGLIDYQDDCDGGETWPQVYTPTNTWLCEGESYTFEAASAIDGFTYYWDFGANASLAAASGIGPHTIQFDPPTDTEAIQPQVIFIATAPTYEIRDTYNLQVRPMPTVSSITDTPPSTCGNTDGSINLAIIHQTGACIEVSLDGGTTWGVQNVVDFNNLPAGSYDVKIRYCDVSCSTDYGIVNLSDPNTVTSLGDKDFASICPGQAFQSTVADNDTLQNSELVYAVATQPASGTVAMQPNGDFVYTSDITSCSTDQFSYSVCDATNTCCATASVTLNFNDTTDPILQNVPADITISCDEEIPLPALITAFDNCPAITIDKDETSTQGLDDCSQFSYTITRTWTATDLCGNSTSDQQKIVVQDNTSPDIFRIYTLPNGKKMIAGVMENIYQEWKTVSFPIQFTRQPVIFTQVVSSKDDTPVTTRIRNVSTNQFELKLQEETANDNLHGRENIAWIAIEEGTQIADYQLEVGREAISEAWNPISFATAFSESPAVFASAQSIRDKDPILAAIQNVTTNGMDVQMEEETSVDTDITHTAENTAYLAIEQVGNITNARGDIIGEVGTIDVDHTGLRVTTNNKYYNPVIIAQVMSNQETTPVTVRVTNKRASSFDLHLQEWAYSDTAHIAETVAYMVIEGSIPLEVKRVCEYGTDSLKLGTDIIAIDNCDPSINIQYEEGTALTGATQQIIRTWYAEDACGNHTVYSQVVNCEGVAVQLKAFLQGALVQNAGDGLMRDDLRVLGIIPTTEPYTDLAGFTHVGAGGGETVSQELLDQTGPDAIVDWVFLELMDAENFEQVLVTCSGLIQRDGDIVTNEGNPLIGFYNIPHGDYYIRVRHRNHLGLETLFPYTCTANNIPFIDFTYDFTPVRGNTPRVLVEDDIAMWAGDLNGDNNTIFQGPNNDIFYMFLHILLDESNESNLSNFISGGYTEKDFNMDGKVIFQGPGNDRSILLWNTVFNHPNNDQNQSNFIVSTAEVVEESDYDDCVRDNTQNFCDFDGDGKLNGSDPDDDNDGVTDGNDIAPYDKESDTDGDGIKDRDETGNDGIYHLGTDSDPLSPCDPNQNISACVGEDTDGDAYFSNYPVDHDDYDPNDQNACEPSGAAAQCGCPDEDGDGYIYICNRAGNFVGGQTVSISVEDWLAQQGSGNECGPCKEAVEEDCSTGVSILNSATATATGQLEQGIPSMRNFQIPHGENRRLIVVANFERDHCRDFQYCNPNYSGNFALGDNYASPTLSSSGKPQISVKFASESGNISKKNSIDGIPGFHSGDFVYQLTHHAGANQLSAKHSRESYIISLNEAEIEALLGGSNTGTINLSLPNVVIPDTDADDAILFAVVAANVDQGPAGINLIGSDYATDFVDGIPGNFTKSIAQFAPDYAPDQTEDGLLVVGVSGLGNSGFQTMEGFTTVEAATTDNTAGNYMELNEPDGMSAAVQFSNTPVSGYFNSLDLQSTGDATLTSNGGLALAIILNSCAEPPVDNTVALIDNDNDGYAANLYSSNSAYDPDDANPCIPNPNNQAGTCLGVDADNDGFYPNYSPTHEYFDSNDGDTCFPETQACNTCEDYDEDGYLVVCKRGANMDPAKTQLVSVGDWPTTKQPGDYCGPCAEYITIAPGNWEDPAIWKAGQAPPHYLTGENVIINHEVLAAQTISVNNNSYLWVQDNQLSILDDQLDLVVQDGAVYFLNASFFGNNDVILENDSSKLVTQNANLAIKKRFKVLNGRATLLHGEITIGEWLDYTLPNNAFSINGTNAAVITKHIKLTSHNDFTIANGLLDASESCLNLKRDWKNTAIAQLSYVCLEIGKDLINDPTGQITGDSLNIYLSGSYAEPSGNLINTGTIDGQIGALYVPNGYTSGPSGWSATVENACISENNEIPANYILNQDCSIIVSQFSECTCLDYIVPPALQIDTDMDGFYTDTDPDDNNSCIPEVGEACNGIDNDGDGYYANYDTEHELYDTNDMDACIPMSCTEICDNGVDDNGDGLIDCADSACENIFTNGSFNFIPSTKLGNGTWIDNNSSVTAQLGETVFMKWQPDPAPTGITSIKWINQAGAILGEGNYLTISNLSSNHYGTYTLELTSDAGCEFSTTYEINPPNQLVPDTVKVLTHKTANASGQGASGVPAITGFHIPAGANRQLVVLATFERNHCNAGFDCPSNGSNYTGLGDNYTSVYQPLEEREYTLAVELSSPFHTVKKMNETDDANGLYHSDRNMTFYPGNTVNYREYFRALNSHEYYLVTFNETDIANLLNQQASGNIDINLPQIQLPTHNGDDATLLAVVLENVDQSNTGTVVSGKVSNGEGFYSLTGNYDITNLIDGTEPNEPTDGLLVIGSIPVEGDFQTMSAYTEVATATSTNLAAGSTSRGEADGVSSSAQFRNGPTSGILDVVNMKASGISKSGMSNPPGGVVFALTFNGAGTDETATPPPPVDNDMDGVPATNDPDDNNACVPVDCIEICDNNIDDDGDGLIDSNDDDCICQTVVGYADAHTGQSGVTYPNNIYGAPNNTAILLDNTNEYIVVDLTDELPTGTNYTITWRRAATTSADPNIKVEESIDGTNWTNATGSPFTFANLSYFDQQISASTTTRYLRLTSINVYDAEVDAISYTIICPGAVEICDNNIDDDGDGLIDCEDGDCNTLLSDSFNFISYTKLSDGNWIRNNNTESVPLGGSIKLGWQPAPEPANTTVKWLAPDGNIAGTAHDLEVTNFSVSDAGIYTLELLTDNGCQFSATYNISLLETVDSTCIDHDNDGLLTVCKRTSDTDNGTTQNVSVTDWATTQGTYDYCGPCADYITVAHGDWTNTNTWKNGNKPPYNISGKNVRINHGVTVYDTNTAQIALDNDANLSVDHGELTLLGDNIDLVINNGVASIITGTITVGDDLKMNQVTSNMVVSNGTLIVKKRVNLNQGLIKLSNSQFTVADGLDLTRSTPNDYDKAIYINNTNASIVAKNSTLTIHHSLQIKSGNIDLEGSCATIKMHWLNEIGTATLTNTSLEVAADLTNQSGSTTTFNNSSVYLSDENPFNLGNLISTGNVSGNLTNLYLPHGYANVQSWNATINRACIAETSSNDIPSGKISLTDCNANITQAFTNNACFEVRPPSTEPMVNLLNENTVKAAGKTKPSLSSFHIPAGSNRQMIVLVAAERNHCGSCPIDNSSYAGLGDNFVNGVTNGAEKDFQLQFRLKNGTTTKTKKNSTNDAHGNFHSARNMVFNPQSNWQQELEDYHKALYSTELYFITYNEAEINALLNGATSGDITIDFPQMTLPTHNADDAILTAMVYENVAQDVNGVALSGKLNEGKEFRPADYIYQINNLIDGVEPNEPTDGFFVVGYSPIEGDFRTMPDFGTIARLSQTYTNATQGSTTRGEPSAISSSGQFRRGPLTGIINTVTMQGEGVSNPNALGGVILAFTLESVGSGDLDETGTPPPPSDNDGDGFSGSADPDDNNACIPDPSNGNCGAIDADHDGYYENFASSHPLKDSDDTDNCVPNNTECNQQCNTFYGLSYICNNPGANQQTILTDDHNSYNNYHCGPCLEYRTIADGNWEDPSTWLSGYVPPHAITDDIRIDHTLTSNQSISVQQDGMLWIENGDLTITGSLTLEMGAIYLDNGALDVSMDMTLNPALATLENFFLTRSSAVNIGGNYINNNGPGVYHEFSCVTVGGNYEKLNCGEVFDKACLTTGGNFVTSGNNIVFPTGGNFDFIQSKGLLVMDAHFHIGSNFVNNGLIEDVADVTLGFPIGRTGFQTLWVAANVDNNQTWIAAIGGSGNYFIGGANQVPSNQIYGTQRSASTIGNYFNNNNTCSCN